MNQSAYFDLYNVLVNELVGDLWLFVLLGWIIIWYQSVKSNMPYQVTILFAILWGGMVFSIAFEIIILWAYLVLGAGMLFYYSISKRMNQG